MNIWGVKEAGHDGALCNITDGVLTDLIESEKLGNERFAEMSTFGFLESVGMVGNTPDAIAFSSWHRSYREPKPYPVYKKQIFGKEVLTQLVGHARSHLLTSYAMSPFVGQDVYCLLWEGTIGTFYELTSDLKMRNLCDTDDIMFKVGNKYQGLYKYVSRKEGKEFKSGTAAGTMMALVAYDDGGELPEAERLRLIDYASSGHIPILDNPPRLNLPVFEGMLEPYTINDVEFFRAAKFLSDYIYAVFHSFAKANCMKGLPLIIAGGCGYNCDWNTMWKNSGIFTDVFVPPIPGDAGVSVGAAVDTQYTLTGSAQLEWDVFSGPNLIDDHKEVSGKWDYVSLTPERLAFALSQGALIPVVYGRAEIGPRALGHRSILMDPTRDDCKQRMNDIKKRQMFRPIAPMCLEEKVSEYFEWEGPSPYMLYFQKVRDTRLIGITHVDNSARLQTVSESSDPFMHKVLTRFQELRGVGCLANSSLNFPGKGFLKSTGQCSRFAEDNNLKYFVAGDRFYIRKTNK